jgi:glycosyltransferase involved in cell wall biosynthesis/uncharacterized membrane protein YbhN (UPF0104 family)
MTTAKHSEIPSPSGAADKITALTQKDTAEHLASAEHTGRIRVVQVVNSLAPAGAELLTADLARSLDPDKWDVHVLVVRDGQLRSRIEQAGLPVYRTGYEFDYTFPLALAKMVEHIRRVNPHIVHTHLLGSDILGRIAALMAGAPIIVSTQHDTYKRSLLYEIYRRLTGRFISAQVAISESVAEFCRRQLRTPETKLHVINNGVDPVRFTASESPWREPPTFGAVGSLIPVKGHAYLIEAFARVVKEIPGARLRIAGEGSGRAGLERLVGKLGISDSVELMGFVSDIPGFLAEIDVLVHPSLMEGLGLAVLEAMSAAKPVIASDIPALAAVLERGAAGELVPPADSEALAAAMLRVVRDPEAALAKGRRGRARVIESYSLEATVAGYADLYDQLIEEAGIEGDATGPLASQSWRPMVGRMWRWARYALFAAVGVLIFQSLRQGIAESSFVDLDFDVRFLMASLLLFVAYYLSFIGGLRLLFRGLGYRLSFAEVFKLSFISNVGKYVPGGIWPIASRMALASKVGIEPPQMLVVSILESALSVVGGSAVVLAAFALGAPAPTALPMPAIVGVSLAALAVLHPAVLRSAVRFVARFMHVEDEVVELSAGRSVTLALYYSITWLVAGAAFYTFVRAILPDPVASPLAYAGYYAAGAIVGLIVLFAPGGLGAREGALVLLLAAPVGTAQAAVIAVSVRVWTALMELGMSLLAVVLPFRERESTDEAP